MSVVGSAQLLAKTGDQLAEAKWGTTPEREFVMVYSVKTDTITDGPYIVAQAPGLPAAGDPWEFPDGSFDLGVHCYAFSYHRVAPFLFEVTCKFGLIENIQQDKLNMKPVPSWDTEEQSIPVMGIMDGNTFVYSDGLKNSAGEIFTPPVMMPLNISILNISRYEPAYTDIGALKFQYEGTVSTDTFWGWNTPCVRLRKITATWEAQTVNSQVVYLWHTNYNFEFNPFTQHLQILDQGSYFLAVSGTKQIAFKTNDGQPRVGLLDGTGLALGSTESPVFLNKQIYPEISWSALALPQSSADCIPT